MNAVCYLDDSGQTFLSGSDDSLIKIWDTRASTKKARGILCGHVAGITCLAVRADGVTVASNGKDERLKVWDVRAMRPATKVSCEQNQRISGAFTHFE